MSTDQLDSISAEAHVPSHKSQFGNRQKVQSQEIDTIIGESQPKSEKQYQPLQFGGALHPIRKSLSQRSYFDGYGYTKPNDQGDHPESQDNISALGKEFEVRWNGEDDPMNPRSTHTPRKWLIVLIVCASSLCVYVFPTLAFDHQPSPV